jgi:MYXO-CTERM domain-containing protein
MHMRTRQWTASIAFVLALGCDEPGTDMLREREGEPPIVQPPAVQHVAAPLPAAHCTIDVDGIGTISMEDDYLPHVIHCENGGANLEALKAQAVAARSVAYYAIETTGSVCDSQGCQVYSCGSEPTALQIQAVQETSGVYLTYNSTLTYAFFVAGDSGVAPPGCIGSDGAAATEHWITYNEGRSGDDVEQTELGLVIPPGDSSYGQNRGCMGQWSARCLENDNGYDWTAILRFFYGDDIGITQATGECVLPLPGGTTTGVDSVDTGASEETSAAGTTGAPPTTTTPVTTDPAESDAGSQTQGPADTTSDDLPSDGTAYDDEGGALPATYGEDTNAPAGCACTQSPGAPTPWLLTLLALPGARRRRCD